MPNREMCAACVQRTCDCTAVVFRKQQTSPDFSQSQAERLPGNWCERVAWRQIVHVLRTRGADYIGGEVLRL